MCNFTPVPRPNYRIGVPEGDWTEVFNSDAIGFGGSGIGNGGTFTAASPALHGQPGSIELILPPLATIVLRRKD